MIVGHPFFKFTNVPAPVMSSAKQTFLTFGEDINKQFNNAVVPRA